MHTARNALISKSSQTERQINVTNKLKNSMTIRFLILSKHYRLYLEFGLSLVRQIARRSAFPEENLIRVKRFWGGQ